MKVIDVLRKIERPDMMAGVIHDLAGKFPDEKDLAEHLKSEFEIGLSGEELQSALTAAFNED